MTRYAHFVGTLPPDLIGDDRSVLEWFGDLAHRYPVTAIPCDIDPDWIDNYLADLSRHPAFALAPVTRPGSDSAMPSYQLRPGHRLIPDDVSMNRHDRIVAIAGRYAQLQAERPELAATPLQVSLPNPLDLAVFAFAGGVVDEGLPLVGTLAHPLPLAAAIRHLPTFTRAVLDEVDAVTAAIGRFGIVWQVESPVATLAAIRATRLRVTPVLLPMIARQLAEILSELYDRNAQATLHLCWGDHLRQQTVAPSSLTPVVRLLNAAARRLRHRGTPLPPVHIPCAFDREPAPLAPSFYAPLARLDEGWSTIAGVVAPDSDSDTALQRFEAAIGHPAFAVATTCGFGRRTTQGAQRAADATIATASTAKFPTMRPAFVH
ncbi:hypothetical protein ACIGO9_30585 [Nocardia asteroides]|uniref:hypothetical protein n=1 Tax=Nocardia asteroides TaxID=1824 RepID=UPI0037C8ECF7